MFGKQKFWCPESVRKFLSDLPDNFKFRLYNGHRELVAHLDFQERDVYSFEVYFADDETKKVIYLPSGRIEPEWWSRAIEDIQAFIKECDYLPVSEIQVLGQEIIARLQLGDEAKTDDARNVVMYLGSYPLKQRRRILQFLLELDEDAPWATVQFNLYQVSKEAASQVRTALDLMEITG